MIVSMLEAVADSPFLQYYVHSLLNNLSELLRIPINCRGHLPSIMATKFMEEMVRHRRLFRCVSVVASLWNDIQISSHFSRFFSKNISCVYRILSKIHFDAYTQKHTRTKTTNNMTRDQTPNLLLFEYIKSCDVIISIRFTSNRNHSFLECIRKWFRLLLPKNAIRS